jgi:hypothetical protein
VVVEDLGISSSTAVPPSSFAVITVLVTFVFA